MQMQPVQQLPSFRVETGEILFFLFVGLREIKDELSGNELDSSRLSGKAACLHASNPKFTQKSGTAGFVISLMSVVHKHAVDGKVVGEDAHFFKTLETDIKEYAVCQ